MTDWVGLLPPFAFVMTVGIAVPVALTAHLLYRAGGRPFERVLKVALLEAGLFYLLGTYVLWSIGAGISRVMTLLIVGALASILLVALPLIISQQVIRSVRGTDSRTALRYATYGWPFAMLVVFGIFVVPGGLDRVTFFHIGGAEICLLSFCGISALTAAAVLLQAAVAFFGPGVVSLASLSLQR